jgi:transcriptional regulator with PAS, ATPase and Fis domain
LLISGESGTGKEILAHSIHNLSRRKKGPLVSINCSALPNQLLESELFGYDEGAFTGSRRGGKPGLFEIAHNGTIFLDEIGTTPKNVQARLLRVLQEKEVMRIGSDRMIPIDVRVLSATNKDLTEEVQKGDFREDLFFRINVLHIKIPPLRDRIEDIPCLVKTLIKKASKNYGLKAPRVPDTLVETLQEYSWPGNVRQLEAFLERLILLSGTKINKKIFRDLFQELCMYQLLKQATSRKQVTSLKDSAKRKTIEYETQIIRDALQKAGYSKSQAAKQLGISRATLWRKLKNLNLDEHA